jgi:rubrerythrin
LRFHRPGAQRRLPGDDEHERETTDDEERASTAVQSHGRPGGTPRWSPPVVSPVTEIDPGPSEPTLYVCRDCGDGFEGLSQPGECPACGGQLENTTVPHD